MFYAQSTSRANFIDSVRVHVADEYLRTIIKNWIMCVHVTIYQYQNIIDILPLLDTLRKYISIMYLYNYILR